jgi:regulator of protease activity HflC (stomatin/prohibitin superfamily)
MRQNSSFAALIVVVILGAGGAIAFGLHRVSADGGVIVVMACALVLAYIAASGIKVADQWNKAVVLRLGKFRSLEGPGLFLIIPLVETIPYWIDTRVLTSSFKAEKTLTKEGRS